MEPEPLIAGKILVIEDEQDIARLIRLHLSELCSDVVIASDGTEGLELALGGDWAVIVLDLRLPGIDGLEICRRLRAENKYTPILMLTAKSTELDRVLGLELGADDYLTKPFSVMELKARIKALVRRFNATGGYAAEPGNEEMIFDHLRIHPDRRQVQLDGRDVELTAKEFDLLYFFARHPEKVFNRSQLLDKVWGYGHDGYEHTVNSHINRLRNKIEPAGDEPQFIRTVWGVGYQFIGKPAA